MIHEFSFANPGWLVCEDHEGFEWALWTMRGGITGRASSLHEAHKAIAANRSEYPFVGMNRAWPSLLEHHRRDPDDETMWLNMRQTYAELEKAWLERLLNAEPVKECDSPSANPNSPFGCWMADHPATREEIDKALLHLAVTGDNATKAGNELGMEPRTLRSWRQKHADRYAELRAQHVQQIERALVDDYRENARLSQELHRKATMLALEKLEDSKDPARVAREASIAAGISTDKMLLVDGRPTHIQETRDLDSIIASLGRRYGLTDATEAIESTLTELNP